MQFQCEYIGEPDDDNGSVIIDAISWGEAELIAGNLGLRVLFKIEVMADDGGAE